MDSACPVVKSIKSLILFLLMQSQTFKYLYCRKQNCFVARGDTPETKTFLFLFLGMIHQGNKNVFVSCVSYLKTKTETILFSWCIIPKNKNKNVFVAGVSSALDKQIYLQYFLYWRYLQGFLYEKYIMVIKKIVGMQVQ